MMDAPCGGFIAGDSETGLFGLVLCCVGFGCVVVVKGKLSITISSRMSCSLRMNDLLETELD